MTDDDRDNVILLEPAAAALRDEFLGWQCRLRQLAVRENSGRPSQGMRPHVTTVRGEEIAGGITVLIVQDDPEPSTQLFRYQVLKTLDPVERYDKALQILASNYFQRPRDFSDVMTALFGPAMPLVDHLLAEGRCMLEFSQFSKGYRIPCEVDELDENDAFYQATYWHNRLFNSDIPAGVRVLSFTPDWMRSSSLPAD
ncbi:hypothetical protein [Rhodospirillaceae bacterium SYSU D60014]|uniref:hypothetical protein n=1 Tax=Virgifigura deserti TaxID=2268457 RepID=UPI000E66A70D